MKNNRFYKIVLFILVLLNVVTLTLLFTKPPHDPNDDLRQLDLAEHIGLSGDKADEIRLLQKKHHQMMRFLKFRNETLHRKLFGFMTNQHSDSLKANALINQILENHKQVELLLYHYFTTVNSFCTNEEQRIKLKNHMRKVIFHRHRPPQFRK